MQPGLFARLAWLDTPSFPSSFDEFSEQLSLAAIKILDSLPSSDIPIFSCCDTFISFCGMAIVICIATVDWWIALLISCL